MFNQSPLKLKSIQVSAIMNNKKLSGLVNDALKSAPGSSKREAAASMLRSLNRTSQGMGGVFDGQGGAPFSMQGGQMMYDPRGTQQTAQQPMGTAQSLQPAGPSARQAGIPSVSGVPIAEYPPETTIRPQVIQPPLPKRRKPATTPVTPTGVPTAPVQQPEAMPTGDYYDQWYQSLPQEQQAENKPLLDALKLGLGKKTFAYGELERAGFGTLSEEKQKLEESLRGKYELDTLKRNMDELEERGITIEGSLTKYITNRDQYIEKLDEMINTAQMAFSTKSNMDDPYVKKMSQNYLNYLFVMKGGQQMRYANFLDMGIKEHDAELKRAQNSFNDASKLFERELRSGIEVTEDKYDRLFSILTEMFENVKGRETEDLKMVELRTRVLNAQKKAADAALADVGETKLSQAQILKSQDNYFKANPGATLADWNALSYKEKIRWWGEKDEDEDKKESKEKNIEFYVVQIGSKHPNFWDKDEKKIKWSAVPVNLRTSVLERLRELKAKSDAKKTSWWNIF